MDCGGKGGMAAGGKHCRRKFHERLSSVLKVISGNQVATDALMKVL